MNVKLSNYSSIKQSFDSIPIENILKTAHRTQKELKSHPTFVNEKSPGQFVTEADLLIQDIILNVFASSPLKGSYYTKSEELELNCNEHIGKQYQYQLLIDPLDGTNAFCKGSNDWGVMVGLCDLSGCLLYSWNLLSDGTVFSSDSKGAEVISWSECKEALNIDFFNYGTGNVDVFMSYLNKRLSNNMKVVSFDSAVAVGSALYQGKCNGVLWLPSNQGKKCYPDYDLIFLGALSTQGWQCILGKIKDTVLFVSVAPSKSNLQLLKEVGMLMLHEKLREEIEFSDSLCITGSI